MNAYLQPSEWIDSAAPEIVTCARALAQNQQGDAAIAKACFEFVRDQIQHSSDFRRNPVTCKASDVLHHKTGYCYAKSHLLAALLRANGIPAALCYQRLTITDVPPHCLHGLNAVYLSEYGWYRIDARGNKPGVAAQFKPPLEKLAFEIKTPGEMLYNTLFAEPHAEVIAVLTRCNTWDEVYRQLPDVAPEALGC